MQIATSLEMDRARLEEEVVATAKIAAKLENRLQAAHAAKSKAEQSSAYAEARAREVT